VYANLFGGGGMYMLSSLIINVAISMHKYSTGGAYDLPLISSFLWFGLAGVVAYLSARPKPQTWLRQRRKSLAKACGRPGARWLRSSCCPCFRDCHPAFRARCPACAIFVDDYTDASVPIAFLVFLRTHLATQIPRCWRGQSSPLKNCRDCKRRWCRPKNWLSLGQWRPARRMSQQPLAAILGFSDLLADDPTLPEKARVTAGKIRDQARRTRRWSQFAEICATKCRRSGPLLDIILWSPTRYNARAGFALSKSRIDMQLESVLPGVRGDAISAAGILQHRQQRD